MNTTAAPVEIVVNRYYTEGPVVNTSGELFFTSMASGEIMKRDLKGNVTVWATLVRPNGQMITVNNEHIVCDSGAAAVCRFSTSGTLRNIDLKDWCAGKKFSTPNDIVGDDKGGYYFSDSVRHHGTVFYFNANGEQRIIAEQLDYPNGVALSADKKTLFVNESYRNRILRIGLAHETIMPPAVHCVLPYHKSGREIDNLPDGLKCDLLGNLWVAHYGMGQVHTIDPSGKLIKTFDVIYRCCSNIFLGEQGCFITGGMSENGPGGVVLAAWK